MDPILEVVRIKQVVREIKNDTGEAITSPLKACELAKRLIGDEDREVFLVICLNIKRQITAVHRCHVGTLNTSVVSPREVFKACILNNAHAFIVAHNHPSLSLFPSEDDFLVTKALIKAGKVLEIPLLDHIIVNSKGESLSFQLHGYMINNRIYKRKKNKIRN